MKTLELWRWRLRDQATGRIYSTRHRMTEADAMATDPAAERVPGTLEVRDVPDGPDEHQHTSKRRQPASGGT